MITIVLSELWIYFDQYPDSERIFFVRITPFSPTDDIGLSSRHNCHYITVAHIILAGKFCNRNSTDDDDLTKLTDNQYRFYTEVQKVIRKFQAAVHLGQQLTVSEGGAYKLCCECFCLIYTTRRVIHYSN